MNARQRRTRKRAIIQSAYWLVERGFFPGSIRPAAGGMSLTYSLPGDLAVVFRRRFPFWVQS